MKTGLFFSVLVLAALCVSAPAWADLDQLCLKQCVASATSSSSCVAQCSYGQVAPEQKKPEAPSLSSNRVLNSPVPAGNKVVIAPKDTVAQPGKDYTCLNQCLKAGTSYGFCEKKCTLAPRPAGTILPLSKSH